MEKGDHLPDYITMVSTTITTYIHPSSFLSLCIRSNGLHMHHPVVVALFSHQLFLCANLGNFAGIDHSNDVSVLDGGHVMSNDY